MADLYFYIEGVPAPPPANWPAIELELNYLNNAPQATMKTMTLEWNGEAAKKLYEWYKGGLNGTSKGIYEGPSFAMAACNPPITVFDGCIDLANEETTFQCDVVRAVIKETSHIQFLEDRAEGVSFAAMKKAGLITTADYVAVPYVVSMIPDVMQVALLAISTLQFVKLLKDAIIEVTNLIGEIADSYPAIGLTIWYAVVLALYLLYTVFLVITMIRIIDMLIDNIIQPIKYKYGMLVRDLMTKACAQLGLTFSSTILNNPQSPYYNLAIIPRKSSYLGDSFYQDNFIQTIFSTTINRKYYDDKINPNAWGYYEGSFADLLREIGDVFNVVDAGSGQSGLKIRNSVLYFESWDYWSNKATYTLPNVSTDAPFPNPVRTNASELTKSYLVEWLQDTSDQNTYDQYEGTTCEMVLSPVTYSQKKNILLRGITTKTLNFALAKRKETLTVPEQLISAVFQFIIPIFNELVSLLGGSATMTNPIINNRIGALLLSSDFIGTQKLLVVESSGSGNIRKIDVDNSRQDSLGWTDATRINTHYHGSSWAIDPANTRHNQYERYPDNEIPLCCQDFSVLRDNNIFTSFDKRDGRMESVRWNPHEETARADYRIKQKFTNNLTLAIIVDGTS